MPATSRPPRATLPAAPAGRRRAARALAVLLALGLVACAGPRPVVEPGAEGCDALAAALDDAVRSAGRADAQATPIAGARWLRVDRFAASFADASFGPDARRAWLERLRDADADARRVELANLPASARVALADTAARPLGGPRSDPAATLDAAVARCGRAEIDAIEGDAAALARVRAAARVPDDYVDWQRVLGLYPVMVLPFGAGVRREEASTEAAFARHAGRVADGATVYRFDAPAPATDLLTSAPRDPLDVPRLDAVARAALLAAHAPLWAVEGDGRVDDDRFGDPVLGPDGRARIDTARPSVYARIAFTRWEGRVRVQLVYTAWFPRRAPARALDPLAGHLDGVTLRLTLDEAGRVAMIDSIHACGCWHLFVPVGSWRVRPAPAPGEEWAFVPGRLDAVPPGHRVRVRLAARTHAVEAIDAAPPPADAVGYRLVDDDALRSLPRPDGDRASLYDPRGLVPGTERGERWLFWPMGVPEPGAMRQWGRHATAFVGRRHFDEADLLERRFERLPVVR